MDGPRLTRPDRNAETIRRIKAIARIRPKQVLFANLAADQQQALLELMPTRLRSIVRVIDTADAVSGSSDRLSDSEPLVWGSERLGVGLLTALTQKCDLRFVDGAPTTTYLRPKWEHLVVCEQDEPLSEVIAANYAYSLRAGLYLMPTPDPEMAEAILETYYAVYDTKGSNPSETLREQQRRLRDLCGPLPLNDCQSLTFISRQLPYGIAFPERPSTHLSTYPDLGLTTVNGFVAEQPEMPGTLVSVLIDPETTEAREITAASELLPRRGSFVRGYSGPGANVGAVADVVELFPYDLLLIATHCGDAGGDRCTYEFRDSEGHDRILVVDHVTTFARDPFTAPDEEDLISVTQFMRPVSLDGVSWNDPDKSSKVYVGAALNDLLERTRGAAEPLHPTHREKVGRVPGSAALAMYDGKNYLAIPHTIADEGIPIIINNACSSWHRLSGTFLSGGARAYVGTLFPVMSGEAAQVVTLLFGKYFGKPLPYALWAAQKDTYTNEQTRRPYAMLGVYPQRLRCNEIDAPKRIARRLAMALAAWKKVLLTLPESEQQKARSIRHKVRYYEQELGTFLKNWPSDEKQ